MDQIKIGKFISIKRKEKKLTQSEMGERLGVSDRTVGNWENGRNMPDLSLFKPLCDELGISINELLSGEEISKKDYQVKFEENIINTIDYSNNKIKKKSNIIGVLLIIFGLFISITALSMFKSESSWGSIYSIIGGFISVTGLFILLRKYKIIPRIIMSIVFFIILILLFVFIDFLSVINIKQAPRFRISTTYIGDVIYYDNLFYDVMRCKTDEPGETFNVVPNKHYTDEELFGYCYDLKIKRVKKYVEENSKKANQIIVAKLTFPEDNDYSDEDTYIYDSEKRRLKVIQRIENKDDINKITNVARNANYPEFSNSIGYLYSYFVYDDDNLLYSFTQNELKTDVDYASIGLVEEQVNILNEYIKK